MTMAQDAEADMAARGFARFEHAASVPCDGAFIDVSRPVFLAGGGPALMVMHELPGLSAACVDFAQRLIDSGFEVFLPQLVGPLLRDAGSGNVVRMCISREFAHLRSGHSTPISHWLRDLARRISAERGQRRIGAIGMCLTGAFVIPLLIEPEVAAAVASQPGIPADLVYLLTGWQLGDGAWQRGLNIADEELDEAVRVVKSENKAILIQRFAEDRICPSARVERLEQAFGDRAQVLPAVPTSPRRPPGGRPPHAMMTLEYDAVHRPGANPPLDDPTELALRRVVYFFKQRLNSTGG